MAEESKVDPNAWVTSFGDLITLLMTFFVLIISMSTIKMEDVVEVINNNNGLGDNLVSADLKEAGFFKEKVMSKVQLLMYEDNIPPPINDIDLMYEAIVVFISENKLTKVIELERTKNGFRIRIRADILFASGESMPQKEYRYLLDEIAELLSVVKNDVRVEGHTDDRYSDEFYTDIRLSTARATNVCEYFVNEWMLDPARFGIAGYGRYQPLLPNIDEENRAKNRRVEIIIKEGSKDG